MERLFNIDAQLLFDTVVMACSMLVLFTAMSYLFFNPVRDMLEKRKQRVADEQETAKKEREEAIVYKEEYEQKLKEADKEAARIVDRARNEIELEKKRALDDMKQEMISIATMMAGKAVAASVDVNIQDSLIDETLKEMGEQTWLS